MSGKQQDIRSMADLLKQGATLTDLSCPACSSPLFRYRSGDLWCAQCKKRVIVVKDEKKTIETADHLLLGNLESTILNKIQEVDEKIRSESDLKELQRLNKILSALLENLDRLRKMKE